MAPPTWEERQIMGFNICLFRETIDFFNSCPLPHDFEVIPPLGLCRTSSSDVWRSPSVLPVEVSLGCPLFWWTRLSCALAIATKAVLF